MVYIGAFLIMAIAWIIGKADDRRINRSQKNCEETHAKMYALIDEHFKGYPAHARAYKADADTLIHGLWREAGRAYKPSGIREVTTAKERRERIKAIESGEYGRYKAQALEQAERLDVIDRAAARMTARENISREQGIENVTRDLISKGMDADEARAKAENFRKFAESFR